MALLTKFGTFQAPTSLTTQIISGVGFQPKAIIFQSNNQIGESASFELHHSLGFATGPTEQGMTSANIHSDGSPSAYASTSLVIRSAIVVTYASEAQLVSMDVDGFTLDWVTMGASGGGQDVHYLALGGDDVINAKVYDVGSLPASGTQVYTGLGFQPNTMLFTSVTPRTSSALFWGVGAAVSDSQWAWTGGANRVSNGAGSRIRTHYSAGVQNYSGTEYGGGDVESFDPDGFTIRYSANYLADLEIFGLALELATPAVLGSLDKQTTASAQMVSGFGGEPRAMWFVSRQSPTSPSNYAEMKRSEHLTDGANGVGISVGRPNYNARWSRQSHTDDLVMSSYSSSFDPYGTLNARADVTFGPDGFTADWTAADVTQRQLMYLAFVEVPSIDILDGEYELHAESTTSIDATRERTSALDTSSSSDIAVTADRVRIIDPYAIASDTDLTVANTRVLMDAYTLTQESNAIILSQRLRDTSHAWSSDVDLLFSSDRLTNASYAFPIDGSFTYSTSAIAEGLFEWIAESDLAYVGNAQYIAQVDVQSQLNTALEHARVTNNAFDASASSAITLWVQRLRESGYATVFELDTTYSASMIVRARYDLASDLDLNYISGSRIAGDMTAHITSDMSYRAKPILVTTYEDAFGRVNSRFARGRQKPMIRTTIRPLTKGRES